MNNFNFFLTCLGKIYFLSQLLAPFGFRTAWMKSVFLVSLSLVYGIMSFLSASCHPKSLDRRSQHFPSTFIHFKSESCFTSLTSDTLRWLDGTWPNRAPSWHVRCWPFIARTLYPGTLHQIFVRKLQLFLLSVNSYLTYDSFLIVLRRSQLST